MINTAESPNTSEASSEESSTSQQEAPEQKYSYQLQYRKCSKPTCRTCQNGKGHGPYWYRYWREGSKVKSKYIGKHLPAGVTPTKSAEQTSSTCGADEPSIDEKKNT